eukprot:gene19925-14506_t
MVKRITIHDRSGGNGVTVMMTKLEDRAGWKETLSDNETGATYFDDE